MSRYHLIKVIKRVAREPEPAEVTQAELSTHEQAREQAETVKNWISEFRQTRQTSYQEIKQHWDGCKMRVTAQGNKRLP
jgi:protein subunit release factor B